MTMATDAFPLIADPEIIAAGFSEAALHSYTHADAIEIGEEIVRRGRERGLVFTVSVKLGDREVYRLAFPGTSTVNDEWIRRKRNVAEATGLPSFVVGQRLAAQGLGPVTDELPEADFAPHGGSVPIVIDGSVQGSVTVSGLPQQDDHALIIEVLGARR